MSPTINDSFGCIEVVNLEPWCTHRFETLCCPVETSTGWRITPASLLGDHSVSDPPDPIPNSAVKPDCADGTIAQALEE
jgi:hypothetical protein